MCEKPKEVGPLGGLLINDFRIFLLEVAGESPRLRQDGGIFQKEERRFLEALPPHPAWLDKAFTSSRDRLFELADSYVRALGFVEIEADDKTTTLKGSVTCSAG